MPGTSTSPVAPLHPETPHRDPHASTDVPRLAFRPDVEGLRGVAVLLVVAFHAGVPGFSGGFVGVDVFFVLSGYLITALLVAEVDGTGRVDLARFYARRARRLLPASALALLAVIVAGTLVYSPLEALRPARAAVATAVYASNVLFAISLNYFAPAAETNPLLPTWSLAVEEQFYLVWPVLILLAARRSRGRVAVVLATVSVVSLAACAWLTGREPAISFYATPLRAWEFGVGGLACLLPARALAAPRSRGAVVLAGAGAAAVLASAVLFP